MHPRALTSTRPTLMTRSLYNGICCPAFRSMTASSPMLTVAFESSAFLAPTSRHANAVPRRVGVLPKISTKSCSQCLKNGRDKLRLPHVNIPTRPFGTCIATNEGPRGRNSEKNVRVLVGVIGAFERSTLKAAALISSRGGKL